MRVLELEDEVRARYFPIKFHYSNVFCMRGR